MSVPRRTAEVHVFVLWSEARHLEARIRADIEAHFRVLDTIEVTWTRGEVFASNLTRMYGDALPPDSEKERHCGAGPFLLVIVEDSRPRYRLRRTNRGHRLLNATVFDARARYRAWTGGGYRVHASDSPEEAERNLVLLVGEGTERFRGRPPRTAVRTHALDPIGTHGWASAEELELAVSAYTGLIVASAERSGEYLVSAGDVWWVEHIVGGRDLGDGVREVEVAGQRVRVAIRAQTPPRLPFPRRMAAMSKDLAWTYPRPVTTAAVAGVAVMSTTIARGLLPGGARPESRLAIVPASAVAYVALVVGAHTGRAKQFKHEVLDRFGGDVDDAQTWFLAGLAGATTLVALRAMRKPAGPPQGAVR